MKKIYHINSSDAGDGILWLWWSIPCLVMLWFLKLPEHQQTWYWLCSTDNTYCCSRVNSLTWVKPDPRYDSNGTISFAIFNSLRPSDAIWWHRSGSTLAQVMACCLTAPSHYLNQCWLIISKVLWHSSEGNFIRDTSATIHQSWLENYLPKTKLKFPQGPTS